MLCRVNTLRPRQNGHRFADDTFQRIFLNENVRISIKISLKFLPKCPINNNPALVQIMAWRRSGDKPLSKPMMVSLLTHICVTRPQWVNAISLVHLTTGQITEDSDIKIYRTYRLFWRLFWNIMFREKCQISEWLFSLNGYYGQTRLHEILVKNDFILSLATIRLAPSLTYLTLLIFQLCRTVFCI